MVVAARQHPAAAARPPAGGTSHGDRCSQIPGGRLEKPLKILEIRKELLNSIHDSLIFGTFINKVHKHHELMN